MTDTPRGPEPAGAASGPASGPTSGGRQRWIAAALAALLVALVAITALVFNRPGPAAAPVPSETVQPTETPTPTPAPAPTPTEEPEPPRTAMNILLIGSDIRGSAQGAEDQRAATGQRPDHRADAIMLVHVPVDRQGLYGVSLMRDMWVNIPGHGGAKINSSLEIGGVPLAAQTVSTLLNTPIDHTVLVDFEGFKRLTDALGGVEVDVKVPFTSTQAGNYNYPPGINHLDGLQALVFVRERYAFSDGDYQRVRNQQIFLRSVLAKMVATGGAADPETARNLVAALAPHVTTTMDAPALAWLAFSLRGTQPENAIFFTLPTAGTGFSADGQSIVVQDPAATAQVGAALSAGTIGDYIAANGLGGGN